MKGFAFISINLLLVIGFACAVDNKEAQMKLQQMKIDINTISLLQYAASGDLNTLKLIIASGININQQDPINGATALHNAAAQGHLEMVKWLINNKADNKLKDKHGYSALDWAIYHKHKKVINYLKQRHKSQSKLQNKSAGKAQNNALKTILDYSTSVNSDWVKQPQSSFHDWKQAQTQAQSIVDQWKNTATSIPWTKLLLQKYIKHKMMPGRSARGLALTHVAMHDAYIIANENQQDTQLAVSMSAAMVLSYLFPAEEKAFKRTVLALAALKYSVERDKLPINAKAAILAGQQVANRVIKYAQNDGAQRGWNGTRLQWYGQGRWYGPGSWEPTPPYFYYPPEEPYAPTWKTWVLNSASQFRANPPPTYASKEFIAALKEVIDVDKNLTDEQLKSAKFWVDGHGSVTPAGHWNQIAMEFIQKVQFDDLQTIQLFAQLNIALADTYISAWDTKYHYWSIRPVTAAKKILGMTLKPVILTPPFPSYVSGHAATSGAASQILADYFPASAQQLIALGDQAAMSRLYGGIHYRFDNDAGLIMGRHVAQQVISAFKK